MATLQIKKKSLRTWEHIDSQLGMFILSKFEFSTGTETFQVVEANGAKRRIYNISDIEVFDIGGTAETFGTVTQLSLRLEELKYPGFYRDGDVIFEIDPNRVVISNGSGDLEGADPAFYPDLTELSFLKGVTTSIQTQLNDKLENITSSITNITAANLTAQTVAGFVTYINGVSSFDIAANETKYFVVTDSGQVFMLNVHGVSVGSGETPLTSSDIIEINNSYFVDKFQGDRVEHQATGGAISSFGAAAPTGVGSGTNGTADFTGTYTSAPRNTWNRRTLTGAASAGTSVETYDNARFFIANELGYYTQFKVANDASTNSRAFHHFSNAITATGNVDPSTLLNTIGIGYDSADANWQIMHNDGSGTATKVNTGINPDKTNSLANNMREKDLTVEIWNFYGSASVYFRIKSLRQNTTFFHVATTNLPSVTTGLTYHLWANSGSDAVAPAIYWSNILIQRQS